MENARGFRNFILILIGIILIGIIFLCSCSTHTIVPKSYEDQIIITKKYVGRLELCVPGEKYTIIMTDQACFKIYGQVIVPKDAWCYVRFIPCYWDVHPDIRAHLEQRWFSYLNGSGKKEYRIKNWYPK